MATSQNGWPALGQDSPVLHSWRIPTADRPDTSIRLRNGSAGFLLCHFALWFAEVIEPLDGKILDDWGYAFRPIRGDESTLSNHSSGTAMDLNATKHPMGVPTLSTFTRSEVGLIHDRLKRYRGALRWGGDYKTRPDAMHVELNVSLAVAENVAVRLSHTERGHRVLDANPGQLAVILS